MTKQMNLLIIASLLLFSASSGEENNRFDFCLQAGINLVKVVKGDTDEKYEMKMGIPVINLESHFFPFRKRVLLKGLGFGLGTGFVHLPTEDTDIGWMWTYGSGESGALYWWPIYLSLKYNFPINSKLVPYMKLDNGGNVFDISDNILIPDDRPSDCYVWGGYYFSVGIGLTIGRFFNIELSYSRLNSGIGSDSRYRGYWTYWDDNFRTRILTFSVGFGL